MEEKASYTRYEKARILGARALQISANAPILLKLSEEKLQDLNYDPIKIAELEFEEGILPITVTRPLPKKIAKKLVEPKEVEIAKEEKPVKPKLTPEEEAKKEEKPKEKAKIAKDSLAVELGETEETPEDVIAKEFGSVEEGIGEESE